MDKLQYVMDLMHRDFGCSKNSADYATESILLFRNELDRNLLPDFFDEINLEKEVLVHYYAVDEYIVYIITDATNSEWKLLGVLKDNKLTFHKAFV
ncbi:hypothetical protein [Trichococcus pasteurii]|uniref:Uncharacterized protein n=1 Tax=Trichococcus pasteurii TaxID=43064 RepID=A0A1W1IDC8_9LACT|nr:hypothetical protein [Trichococcus pasteurii]SFF04351.1 hypothetical protein SAMN04488086_1227 [Trichococcus pasteurii]SLM51034.1 Hypothetical protein TPAS_709 [Trichococcus pasteurii]SSB91915.1 Hypothetical protein TPAS_709 [Trichococcus pasteurii]